MSGFKHVHKVASEWASNTARALLLLGFMGHVWGPVWVCMGPVYGHHGTVLRQLQHRAASCSC